MITCEIKPDIEPISKYEKAKKALLEADAAIQALTEWEKGNLQYPVECVENKIEGRAFVRFLVKKDGSIDDVELLKSSGNTLLDQEALRLINDDDMPQWIPATQFSESDGKYIKVDSRFVMPIVFKLNNVPTCTNPE